MRKGSKLAIGAALLAGVGYLAGILNAPRSGWRTRQKIKKDASKARIQAEKELKKHYADLIKLIKSGEAKVKQTKSSANNELNKQLNSAKKAKDKVKMLLTAIHSGEASDPDLKKVINEAQKAKSNLGKFIKK